MKEIEKNLDETFSKEPVSEGTLRNIGKKICEKYKLKEQYNFSAPLTDEQKQSLDSYIEKHGLFTKYSTLDLLNAKVQHLYP